MKEQRCFWKDAERLPMKPMKPKNRKNFSQKRKTIILNKVYSGAISNFMNVIDVDIHGRQKKGKSTYFTFTQHWFFRSLFRAQPAHARYFSSPTNFFYNSNQFSKVKSPLEFPTSNPTYSYHHHWRRTIKLQLASFPFAFPVQKLLIT